MCKKDFEIRTWIEQVFYKQPIFHEIVPISHTFLFLSLGRCEPLNLYNLMILNCIKILTMYCILQQAELLVLAVLTDVILFNECT